MNPTCSELAESYNNFLVGLTAFVIPIPKISPPGSIEDDLRPISLTSQIGKVMEGFTLDSLLCL